MDKYIISNISMFNANNKIYLYTTDGDSKLLSECPFNQIAEQIAYHCLDNDIELVQINGNKLFLAPIAKKIVHEADKQSLTFNKKLTVKVVIG